MLGLVSWCRVSDMTLAEMEVLQNKVALCAGFNIVVPLIVRACTYSHFRSVTLADSHIHC